jgi:hypothetical protein
MKSEVTELVEELKQVDTKLRKIRKSYDEKIRLLQKKSAKIQGELRVKCDHEWIRDSYQYAELYCKHCTIYRR